MTQPPDDFDPTPGAPIRLADGLRRVLAPNPSPMTYRGTNTYLIGDRELAVIDPGPMSEPHLEAILAALEPGQSISHIIVTHSHLDHSPLARPLAERTGAPVIAFGGAEAGRSAIMSELAAGGLAGGGEGIDRHFAPDRVVTDGEIIEGDDWSLEVLHTPGHLGNHIALGWGGMCFTADHVMGWASSLVSPPDGDLTDFMASCRRLRARNWEAFHPGHGAPIESPDARLDWLIEHRLAREAAILLALENGAATARSLAERVYTETPPALLGAAERNVFAHLIDLAQQNRVSPQGELAAVATFERLS
ncbi:MBL fold metallo-hydrolase [Antarcticimicrobium sediminis]|uniref:MBL fold metallo-hydrolase n=1 Tax=Antarcticimicrobium sediminis TaxID=2546227 RepID=A0A4R5EUJ1_9RHOB|nr:MBL fold metallo-hydrolase [Antarcticimicrobium sediminis]TDE38493.1 MBL fold metallo-hydrolase [Antarcticimicrobium sediminis]